MDGHSQSKRNKREIKKAAGHWDGECEGGIVQKTRSTQPKKSKEDTKQTSQWGPGLPEKSYPRRGSQEVLGNAMPARK